MFGKDITDNFYICLQLVVQEPYRNSMGPITQQERGGGELNYAFKLLQPLSSPIIFGSRGRGKHINY